MRFRNNTMSNHIEKKRGMVASKPSPPAAGSEILDGDKWQRYVQLVAGMATDAMLGRGPTPRAFVNNLRLIADQMEDLLPNTSAHRPGATTKG